MHYFFFINTQSITKKRVVVFLHYVILQEAKLKKKGKIKFYQKGAIIGTLVGFGINVWKFVGTQMYPKPAEFRRVMPVSTEECLVYVAGDQVTQDYYNTTDSYYDATSMNSAYLNATTTELIEVVEER